MNLKYMGVSCAGRTVVGNTGRRQQRSSLRVLHKDHYSVAWCKLLSVLLAAADFIFSSCRFNNNQISLNSVFFLAQSLSTLQHIKAVSLRYDQEYFCYFFAI